ncbi:hypothetical protein rsdtw13_32110 [Clostridium sp. TW13]|uniref:Uncharacterized protein n=1 Tax=Inconstantimicrobium mannanitabidum TaxID=1604901 RepID=A0ACB5RFT8_9CLOT|nr:hypothetical protein rsdtw13_32110 [Clostridium sp. TW13]
MQLFKLVLGTPTVKQAYPILILYLPYDLIIYIYKLSLIIISYLLVIYPIASIRNTPTLYETPLPKVR